METASITKTITQPVDVINTFADRLGYMETVKNPDYVAPQGSETIVDPTWKQPADFNPMIDATPMVPNPDYVAAVGEPTMPNPMTRTEFVSQAFDVMASDWFAQFARRDAERTVKAQIEETIVQTKEAIKATIATEIK